MRDNEEQIEYIIALYRLNMMHTIQFIPGPTTHPISSEHGRIEVCADRQGEISKIKQNKYYTFPFSVTLNFLCEILEFFPLFLNYWRDIFNRHKV